MSVLFSARKGSQRVTWELLDIPSSFTPSSASSLGIGEETKIHIQIRVDTDMYTDPGSNAGQGYLRGNLTVNWKSLSSVQLIAILWTITSQASLSMEFSRQECWSGLPFPSSEDFPDPGTELLSPSYISTSFKFYHFRVYKIYQMNCQLEPSSACAGSYAVWCPITTILSSSSTFFCCFYRKEKAKWVIWSTISAFEKQIWPLFKP